MKLNSSQHHGFSLSILNNTQPLAYQEQHDHAGIVF